MPQIRSTRDVLAALAVVALFLTGCAANVQAQGELEKTPWATTMVYPVGDPLDYNRPAPGEGRGFSLSRGLQTRGDRHEGLDLTNRAAGGEVRAVAPGLVVTTRTGWAGGWGNMVVLAHRMPGGDLLFSLFAHLLPGSIAVREGEVVALGQPLGKIGSTGRSSGPHLHLEFREVGDASRMLGQPLAQAWMKATIVDPLRMLSMMMPRGTNPLLAALPAAAKVGVAGDPLFALVQRGALAQSTLDHGDAPLSRGELYRLAHTALDRSATRPAARWSTLRAQVLKLASRLPASSRPAFAATALPRREAEAAAPAELAEVVAVFTALERAGRAVPRAGATAAPATDRRTADAQFPEGLAALERAGGGSSVRPAASTGATDATSVSRRQAAVLWAYLEGGRASSPGAAAAATLP